MNWKAWIHSLLAAAIGGASNAALGAFAMPDTFNFTHAGLLNLGKMALIGAVVPVLTLLKQSPLPDSPSAQKNPSKLGVWVFIAILLSSASCYSQVSLSTQATASAFYYQGQWSVGTQQTQQIPVKYFGAQNNNILSFGAREDIVPGIFQGYMALANYQPDLTKLFAGTTFNPDQFSLSFDLAGGQAMFPTLPNKPMIEGRLNVSYSLTPGDSLTGGYAGGGFIGQNKFYVISAGWQHIFGAQNVPTTMMKRLIFKSALKKQALQGFDAR